MNTKAISMLAGLAMLAGGCTSETYVSDLGNENGKTEGMEFTVSFGGAGSKTLSTRAQYQNDEEKEVTSLYAVLFKDVEDEGSAYPENGKINTEDDNKDLYMSAVSLLTDGSSLEENKLYSISVPENGHYQVCFIANADEDLARKLSGFGYKTGRLSDFKAVVAEQEPGGKPMLMTSDFYAVNIDGWKESIGTVNLKRVMARIDIQNLNPDITVTKIEFTNRANKSVLYKADNSFNEDYLETKDESAVTKPYIYDDLNLVGNASQTDTGNKLERTIYTYEQFATNEGKTPKLTITYKTSVSGSEETKTADIEFKNNNDSPINLQRNHLYRVRITAAAGIQAIIDVADWEEGAIFEVANSTLVDNADPSDIFTDASEAEIGDFILADGRFARNNDKFRLNPLNEPIAMVVYMLEDETNETHKEAYMKTSMNTQLGGNESTLAINGLAVSVKYLWRNGGLTWRNVNSDVDAIPNYSDFADAYNALDGLGYTEIVNKLNTGENDEHTFPAFTKIAEYQKRVPTPSNTTKWYMPSIGEIMDMWKSFGLNISESVDSEEKANAILNSINGKLKSYGTGADIFFDNNKWLHVSSEYDENNVWFFNSYVEASHLYSFGYGAQSRAHTGLNRASLRAFLAF